MINERWPLRALGELFEIGAGKTMSAAARDGEGKIPFLRTSNVLWDEIDLSTVDRMTIPAHELESRLLRPGDLLVCEGGEIGRSAVWNGEVDVMSFQNHLHRLRPLVKEVEPRFYVYFLQSAFTQLGIFEGAGNRTTIPNLSRNRLASLQVPHPDLVEQRAIASVLARVRDGIRVHNWARELTHVLKRVAMWRLFTLGLRGEPQKESEIGPVPQSWDVQPIGQYAREMQYGLSVRGEARGRYPILRMNCQRDGKVVFRELQYVDIDENTAEAYRVRPGDILFNRTNSYELVGRTAIAEAESEAVFASYLVRISVDDSRLKPRFLNHFLNWEVAQAALRRLASRGVGQANISAGKLRGFVIPIPDLGEQAKIASIVDVVDQKIDLLRRKQAVLEDLFRSLLHKLITGELEVTDLDLSALAASGSEPAAA